MIRQQNKQSLSYITQNGPHVVLFIIHIKNSFINFTSKHNKLKIKRPHQVNDEVLYLNHISDLKFHTTISIALLFELKHYLHTQL